jgi:hypothetical protein
MERPTPVQLVTQDIDTVRVRNFIRTIVWEVLKEVGLVSEPGDGQLPA